jgi:hypothetical protein
VTTVRTRDGFSYTLSEDDFLWLGRAASGEGGDPRATIWTWLSRFAGLEDCATTFNDRARCTRALAQSAREPAMMEAARRPARRTLR